jgi:hypothetical protein
MNDDKKLMWKYVVMACIEELPQHSPHVSEEKYEKPHQGQLTFNCSINVLDEVSEDGLISHKGSRCKSL